MRLFAISLTLFFCQNLLSQGLIFNKEKYNQVEKWDGTRKMGFSNNNLPTKISFKAYCPSPGNQGRESTCVGWSVAYGALSIQLNVQMGITDIYHKWARAFDPNFVYSFLRKKK